MNPTLSLCLLAALVAGCSNNPQTSQNPASPPADCLGDEAAVVGAEGFATIQEAIDDALPGDTVQVCPGTWPVRLRVDKPLTLASFDEDPTTTVLRGDDTRILDIRSAERVEIRDLGFEQGVGYAEPDLADTVSTYFDEDLLGILGYVSMFEGPHAGAVLAHDTSLVIAGAQFRDNQDGAVVVLATHLHTVKVTDTVFADNTRHTNPRWSYPTPLWVWGTQSVSVSDSTFYSNGPGGVTVLGDDVALSVDNSLIHDHWSAAVLFRPNSQGDLTIRSSELRGNVFPLFAWGANMGIHIDDSTFQSNNRESYIYCAPGSVCASDVENSTFRGNSGWYASVFYFSRASGDQNQSLYVSNSVFEDNRSDDKYGSVINFSTGKGNVNIDDSTFTRNYSPGGCGPGGGIERGQEWCASVLNVAITDGSTRIENSTFTQNDIGDSDHPMGFDPPSYGLGVIHAPSPEGQWPPSPIYASNVLFDNNGLRDIVWGRTAYDFDPPASGPTRTGSSPPLPVAGGPVIGGSTFTCEASSAGCR